MKEAKFDKQPVSGCLSFLKDNSFLVLGIIIAISFCMYSIIGVYGFSAFPDEFGYWSPAAALLGYDWTQITSLGSYYSYGYSILLAGILAVFQGSISAYRAAIIVNLLLQCASILILNNILAQIAHEEKNTKAIIAAISVLYPAWVFYVQTTMAESLLNFLFILSCFLMLEFLKKPGAIRGLALVLVLAYCYLVHMRCIGLLGAGGLTIVIWLLGQNKKKIGKKVWLLPVCIIILFGASFIIKDIVTGSVYKGVSGDMLSWNDYSSIPYRVMKTFEGRGFRYLLLDAAGKLFYLGLSTYGIAYYGIVCIIRNIAKKEKDNTFYFWLFLFLAIAAQFLVSLIYLNGASSPDNVRIDEFLHGRYFDFCVPILLAIGLIEMLSCKKLFLWAGIEAAVYGVLFWLVRGVIVSNAGMDDRRGLIMIGMSFFLGEKSFDSPVSYLYKETALRIVLSLVVIAVVIIYRKFKYEAVLITILAIQILLSFRACDDFIIQKQQYIYGDILVGDNLKDLRAQYPERRIVHVFEGGRQYIELVQFTDRNAYIETINAEYDTIDISEYLDENVILILRITSDYYLQAEEFYDDCFEAGHLSIFYNKE